jgi:hypothetical protein
MLTQLAQIALKFRDIPDVLNHRPQFRILYTRAFDPDDRTDAVAALDELFIRASTFGLTKDDLIRVKRRSVDPPAT